MAMPVDLDEELRSYEVGCLGAALLRADLTIAGVSEGVEQISGHDRHLLLGKSALDVVHPDDVERAAEALFEYTKIPGPTAEGMYRLRFDDETYHDFSVAATGLGPERQNATIFQFRTVSPRLRVEEFARDTVETLRMLAESPPLHVCLERVHRLASRHIHGAHLVITTFDENGAATSHRRSGLDSFDTSGASRDLPDHIQEALDEHVRGPWRAFNRMAAFSPGEEGGLITSVLTDDDNNLLGYVDATRPGTHEPDDHEWMVHGLIRQALTALLQRVRLDEQLRRAAELDPLTGLANRRKLFDDMNNQCDLVGTSLLLLDLDRFSWINNTRGHHVGDAALVAFAERLIDVCPDDSSIARFGGDEFVIWAPEGHGQLVELAEKIREQPVKVSDPDGSPISVYCSVGAVNIRQGETPTDAIRRADEAMYIAKRRGGDGVHVA